MQDNITAKRRKIRNTQKKSKRINMDFTEFLSPGQRNIVGQNLLAKKRPSPIEGREEKDKKWITKHYTVQP